jgi:hypothetical protein
MADLFTKSSTGLGKSKFKYKSSKPPRDPVCYRLVRDRHCPLTDDEDECEFDHSEDRATAIREKVLKFRAGKVTVPGCRKDGCADPSCGFHQVVVDEGASDTMPVAHVDHVAHVAHDVSDPKVNDKVVQKSTLMSCSTFVRSGVCENLSKAGCADCHDEARALAIRARVLGDQAKKPFLRTIECRSGPGCRNASCGYHAVLE